MNTIINRHAVALNTVINPTKPTPVEQVVINLAVDCDALMLAISNDSDSVASAYQAVRGSMDTLGDTSNPAVKTVGVLCRVAIAKSQLDTKREMMRELLIALSQKNGPNKWHIFGNAWNAQKFG